MDFICSLQHRKAMAYIYKNPDYLTIDELISARGQWDDEDFVDLLIRKVGAPDAQKIFNNLREV